MRIRSPNCILFFVVALASGTTATAFAQASSQTPSMRQAARVVGDAQHIFTADGVEKMQRVTIGGIPQWISVRGRHRSNPILLFLHGGPGFTSMPEAWLYQRSWEEYFTVVQWDQRGAGKTYAANDPARIGPTMTIDRMLADAEELVAYLRKTYGKRKIVLVGHSWGSFLGARLALKHPDWFYAYVGIGQVVNMRQSEHMGYVQLLADARRDRNVEAVRELESLAPFPGEPGPNTLKRLELERKWLARAGGAYWRMDDHYVDVARLSPDYSEADIAAWSDGLSFSMQHLWSQLFDLDLHDQTTFGCPVILFEGRHDLNVSATLAAQWLGHVRAPEKKLVWFEDSAHMVPEEEPGKMLVHLVNDVLPLTHTAAGGPST